MPNLLSTTSFCDVSYIDWPHSPHSFTLTFFLNHHSISYFPFYFSYLHFSFSVLYHCRSGKWALYRWNRLSFTTVLKKKMAWFLLIFTIFTSALELILYFHSWGWDRGIVGLLFSDNGIKGKRGLLLFQKEERKWINSYYKAWMIKLTELSIVLIGQIVFKRYLQLFQLTLFHCT